MGLEYKFIPIESCQVKTVDETKGITTGYGSVFGVKDLYGEVVDKGAFSDSIKEKGGKYVALWQHDYKEPIGSHQAVEDDLGLKLESRLAMGVQRAKECLTLLKEGVISGMSIGYRVLEDYYVDGVRHLKRVDLWEVSYVTFPANTLAQVTSAKDAGQSGQPMVVNVTVQVDEKGLKAIADLKNEIEELTKKAKDLEQVYAELVKAQSTVEANEKAKDGEPAKSAVSESTETKPKVEAEEKQGPETETKTEAPKNEEKSAPETKQAGPDWTGLIERMKAFSN